MCVCNHFGPHGNHTEGQEKKENQIHWRKLQKSNGDGNLQISGACRGHQEFPRLGACAMTTTFLDNKICTFKILLSWRFRRKTAFWENSPLYLHPRAPTPLKSANFIFVCRLAVSDRHWGRNSSYSRDDAGGETFKNCL